MADQTPQEMARSARTRNRMSPDKDTLDETAAMSGAAQSTPPLPRFDSRQRMTGTARPAQDDHDKSAVSQTVRQETGGVKSRTTARRHRVTRG